jgi:hypothetical protein
MAVASEDGALALAIPEGALPAGVDGSGIRVTTVLMAEPQPLEAPDPDAEEQPSRVVAVFELEPDGLRFLRPVTLTFRLPSDIVSGPLVALHASEEGVEPLAIALAELPESDEIEITASVEHFSKVFVVSALIARSDIIETKLEVSRETVTVGREFLASVDVKRLAGTRTVNVRIEVKLAGGASGDELYSRFSVPYALTVKSVPWQLGGVFVRWRTSTGVISPVEVPDKPKRFLTVTGDTRHEEAIFKCESVGTWTVIYLGNANVEYEAIPDSPPPGVELPRFESFPYIVYPGGAVSGRCVAPPPEDSTTDTAPPEKDPTPEDGTTPEDSTTPEDTDAEPPQPNRPPVVSAIDALFVPYLATTFYDVEISDPDGDRLTISWSGHSCGETEGSTTEEFEWYHGDDVCPHTVASHPEATIQLFVTDRVWDVYCYYHGADDGVGEPCDAAVPSPAN